MKFCTNCGNQLGEERFCTKCGTPVEDAPLAAPVAVPAKKKTVVAGIAIAVVAIIMIAAAVFGATKLFGGGNISEEKIIEKYVNSMVKMDFKTILSLIPDEMIDYIVAENGYGSRKEMIADIEEEVSVEEEYGISFNDIDVDYEIVSESKIIGDDFRDLCEDFEEIETLKITQAKEYEVEVTVNVLGEKYSDTMDVLLIKVGNSWYWGALDWLD